MSVSSISAVCGNMDSLTPVCDNTSIKSELLCFVADKCRILPFDDLIKICLDFYKEEYLWLVTFWITMATDYQNGRVPKKYGLHWRILLKQYLILNVKRTEMVSIFGPPCRSVRIVSDTLIYTLEILVM